MLLRRESKITALLAGNCNLGFLLLQEYQLFQCYVNLSLFSTPKSMSLVSFGEGQPPFNKPEQHQLPVFVGSHQVPLLS